MYCDENVSEDASDMKNINEVLTSIIDPAFHMAFFSIGIWMSNKIDFSNHEIILMIWTASNIIMLSSIVVEYAMIRFIACLSDRNPSHIL